MEGQSLRVRGEVEIRQGGLLLRKSNQVTLLGALRLLQSVSTIQTGAYRLNAVSLLSGFSYAGDLKNVIMNEVTPYIQPESTQTIYATLTNEGYAFDGTTLEVSVNFPPTSTSLSPYNGVVLISGKYDLATDDYAFDPTAQPFAIVKFDDDDLLVRSTFLDLQVKWRITVDV